MWNFYLATAEMSFSLKSSFLSSDHENFLHLNLESLWKQCDSRAPGCGTDCVLLVLLLETLTFINNNKGKIMKCEMRYLQCFSWPVLFAEMMSQNFYCLRSSFCTHCSVLTWNSVLSDAKKMNSLWKESCFFTVVPVFFCFHYVKLNIFLSSMNWGMNGHLLIFSFKLYNLYNLFCVEIQAIF